MQLQHWPIERFRPYERNPRKNDQAVDRMCASIREYGFAVPVLAKSDGTVVDGHLRLKGAAKLKAWPGGDVAAIPVVLCDGWTDAQVKAFRLMANRSVAWAEWDIDALGTEFLELKALDFNLQLTGFGDKEIVQFLAPPNGRSDPTIGALEYRIVVDCQSEAQQASLLQRFEAEGLPCRPLIS